MYLCSRFPWLLGVLPALVLGVGPTEGLAKSMPAGFMMHEDEAKRAIVKAIHSHPPKPPQKAPTPQKAPRPPARVPAAFKMHEDAAKRALVKAIHSHPPKPPQKAPTPQKAPRPPARVPAAFKMHEDAAKRALVKATHFPSTTTSKPVPRPTSLSNTRAKNPRAAWQTLLSPPRGPFSPRRPFSARDPLGPLAPERQLIQGLAKVAGRVGARVKSPDYVSLNLSSPFRVPGPVRKLGLRVLPGPVRKLGDPRGLPAPLRKLGGLVGSSVHITRDRYGRVYVGGGPSLGTPGGSLAIGWKTQLNTPSRNQLKNFLTGRSDNFGGGYKGGGGGVMRSRFGTAIQAGVYSTGGGYARQYTSPLPFRGSRR